MIYQNTTHPEYDRDMELLITLPCWRKDPDRPWGAPAGVLLRLLGADLWPIPYASPTAPQAPVRWAIERLRKRYAIHIARRLGQAVPPEQRGNEAGIAEASWKQAQADGAAYWARVYGDGGFSAEGWGRMVGAWGEHLTTENGDAQGRA